MMLRRRVEPKLFGWLLTIQAMEGSLRARQKGSFGLPPGLPTDDKQVGEHRDFGDRSGNGDGSALARRDRRLECASR